MAALLTWIESTGLATAIAGSRNVTGALSAAHLVGLTLLVGSAIVRCLHGVGWFLADTPGEVERSTHRGVAIGVTISVVTGLLLWSTRASAASANGFFQIKIILIVMALALQWRMGTMARAKQTLPVLVSLLWFGVVLAGCAFILLE